MFPLSFCCLLPVLLIFISPIIGTVSPTLSKFTSFLTPLICPIMMGGMLIFLSKLNDKSSCCKDNK